MTGPSARLPRALHPAAWWLWALGLATAATCTTNPLTLGLFVAAAGFVVAFRRGDAPWARGFKAYLILGLVILAIRVVFRMVFDGQYGRHILFTLPEIPLPKAAAGIRLGGPVSAEGILAAVYDGVRLATLLICLGAANVLADPKRLLKSTPAALHEVSVAVVVALSVAPQLIESGQRVRRARKLRGETGRRLRLLRTVIIPVMTDALDRSLLLAAAMDSRGFGRSTAIAPGERRLTAGLVLGGLIGTCVGIFSLLNPQTPRYLAQPMLAVGLAAAIAGFVLSGRRVQRSRYRPDRWRIEELAVAACGIVVAGLFLAGGRLDPANLTPSVQPLRWPGLSWLALVGAAVALLPAWIAPPVRFPNRPEAAPTAPAGPGAGDAPVTVPA